MKRDSIVHWTISAASVVEYPAHNVGCHPARAKRVPLARSTLMTLDAAGAGEKEKTSLLDCLDWR